MITIKNLVELRDTPIDEGVGDYLPGIELEDLHYFSESALLQTGTLTDEVLTEGVGSTIWNKIKQGFQAVIKFFKMLGAKIVNFIKSFFNKADSELISIEKETKNNSNNENISKVEDKKQSELEKLEKTLSDTTDKDEQEKIKKKEEKIQKELEILNKIKKHQIAVEAELYMGENYMLDSSDILKQCADAIAVSSNGLTKDYDGLDLIALVFSANFAQHVVKDDAAFASDNKHMFGKGYTNLSSEQRHSKALDIEIDYLDDLKDFMDKIKNISIDYDSEKILNVFRLKKDKNGAYFPKFGNEKIKKQPTEIISIARKSVVDFKNNISIYTKFTGEMQNQLENAIKYIDTISNKPDSEKYKKIFTAQITCCNTMIGVINRCITMNITAFRNAISHNIKEVKRVHIFGPLYQISLFE